MANEIEITIEPNSDNDANNESVSETASVDLDLNLEEVQKSIKVELTEDEKKVIEENKQKRKGKEKEKIEVADNWRDFKFTPEEAALAQSLHSDLIKELFDKKIIGAESDNKLETIPSGIDLLDVILGGGIGLGTMTIIAGNPGTFKSALAGQIIGNAQKKFKGNLLSNYLDSESATTVKRLYNLGVKNPPIKPIEDITIEKVFQILECIMTFKELKKKVEVPGIVVWDSIANTVTQIERDNPDLDINKTIGLRARILSFVLPRFISRLREYNMSLIAINQLRDKISMGQFTPAADLRWMGEKSMPGGNALKFNAFHLLLLKVKGDIDASKYGFTGVTLEAKCIKNKLFMPNIPIKLVVDFSRGVSNFYTSYDFLTDNKYIKSAAWQNMPGYDKSYRSNEAEQLYNTDSEFKKVFDELFNKAVQEQIMDANKLDALQVPEEVEEM